MTLNRRMSANLVCALVASVLAVQAGPAGAAADAALEVTGFQGEWSPTSKIKASADALTTVGVDGVTIASNGKTVGTPSADARRQLKTTHRLGLEGEILISNYDDELGDFNELSAYKLLSSPDNRAAVIDTMLAAVQTQGWDGVSIDIEALKERDRAGLTAFATELSAALPPETTLSINIGWRDSLAGYRKAGFDLPALADVVDRVILMAYDQHGPWDDTPGPIGALPWQEAGLEAMLLAVPAEQVDLGVAGYGYGWRPHSIITMSDQKARSLVRKDGATAEWDADAGEWTATLSDGSVLWWSDARSYVERYDLAAEYELHGLAVWSLGLSDPIEPPGR